MIIVSICLGLVATILSLPALSDLVSLLWLLVKGPRRKPPAPAEQPRLLFLVPAYNEELLVERCVRSIVTQDYPQANRKVVVIADNCTDTTAQIARNAGADCLERSDLVHRGKPHALAWALQQINYRAYDAVLIIDADSVMAPDFARQIATIPNLRSKAVQAFNGVENPGDNAITRMAAVFASGRYDFEFVLKSKTSLNVPLMGNGACIGTEVLDRRGWSAFSISEDWELYAQLTRDGVTIEGCSAARVVSQEARSLKQSASQRKRWTAGRFEVAGRYALPLLRSPKISLRQKLDVLAEMVPLGPVVLAGAVMLLLAITLLLPVPGALWIYALLSLPLLRLVVYTLAGVSRDPQPARALASFLALPGYAVWRLTLQFSAVRMIADKRWIRTERHI